MIEQEVEGGGERRGQPRRVIYLVSPGDTIEVRRHPEYKGEADFVGLPIGRSDIGNISLRGLRTSGEPGPGYNPTRFTVQGGSLIARTWEEIMDTPDLFEINVGIEKGVSLPPGHILHCRLDIDGVDRSFEARIPPDERADQAPALTLGWRSTDPIDTRVYEIWASPADTALLSRFGFSFYTKPEAQSTPY
jgi:hypothetical protein